MKKIPTRITPHIAGARENFNEKRKKVVRKPKKGITAQETQMLWGMLKSLENSDFQDNVSMS